MNLNNLMRLSAIIATIFGLQILIMPAAALEIYDVQLDADGEQMARLYAALLLGFALINALAAKAQNDVAKKAIVAGDCVADVLCTGVILMAIVSGTVNAWAWLDFAVSLAFTLGFGYYAFVAKIWNT